MTAELEIVPGLKEMPPSGSSCPGEAPVRQPNAAPAQLSFIPGSLDRCRSCLLCQVQLASVLNSPIHSFCFIVSGVISSVILQLQAYVTSYV